MTAGCLSWAYICVFTHISNLYTPPAPGVPYLGIHIGCYTSYIPSSRSCILHKRHAAPFEIFQQRFSPHRSLASIKFIPNPHSSGRLPNLPRLHPPFRSVVRLYTLLCFPIYPETVLLSWVCLVRGVKIYILPELLSAFDTPPSHYPLSHSWGLSLLLRRFWYQV